jgi:hypothetical protein
MIEKDWKGVSSSGICPAFLYILTLVVELDIQCYDSNCLTSTTIFSLQLFYMAAPSALTQSGADLFNLTIQSPNAIPQLLNVFALPVVKLCILSHVSFVCVDGPTNSQVFPTQTRHALARNTSIEPRHRQSNDALNCFFRRSMFEA